MSTISYNRPTVLSVQSSVREVFYTGKTINATKASRSVIAEDTTSVSTTADSVVQVGSVLIRDPDGHDKGIGVDYTRPATAFLHEQKVVVVALGDREYPDSIATDGPGRWLVVVDCTGEVNTLIKGLGITTPTTGDNGSVLGVVNGSFALQDLTATDSALPATQGISNLIHPLTSLATGLSTLAIDIMTNYVPGYKFRLVKFDFVTTVAGTGAGASQTFNLEIGTTNVTGGSLALLLADTATIGQIDSATAITALNIGGITDTVSIEMAASGTVFTAGAGYFTISIQNLEEAARISHRAVGVPLDRALIGTGAGTGDLSANNAAVKRCRLGMPSIVKVHP